MGSDTSQDRRIEALRGRFESHGQGRVFAFWERLDAAARERLASQAEGVDLAGIERAFRACTARQEASPPRLEPIEVEALPEFGGDPVRRKSARERGEALLAAGRVAVMVVAGGQATRLGYDAPKGVFPIGPVSDRSLFEVQAQKLRRLRERLGVPIPWYVMTSEATHAPTRDFFERSGWLGLPAEDVFVFRQGMVQSVDFEGRLLLAAPDRLFENPNGHGGAITALEQSGALDDMQRRGVDLLFYYQVDNPLVRLADPLYLGFHDEVGAEMSCKVVRKRKPEEKVGVVARADGRPAMVEYTEIDEEHRNARDAAGELVYWAGNIATHVFSLDFVRRVAADAERLLPYHASAKKIPTVDAEGRRVEPGEPNGYKFERFVFDALPAARSVCVVEAAREEEFSPVKNAEGTDSPETARRDLIAQYRRWLDEAGIEAPPAPTRLEIDHARIDSADDARALGVTRWSDAGGAIRTAPGAES